MLELLARNWGTIAVGAVVAAVIVFIVISKISDRKKGKSSCGCGCKDCPSSKICHKE